MLVAYSLLFHILDYLYNVHMCVSPDEWLSKRRYQASHHKPLLLTVFSGVFEKNVALTSTFIVLNLTVILILPAAVL
jgi:hypothetical protein